MFEPQAGKLSLMDEEIHKLIEREDGRQEDGLEMIASENYTSKAVMAAQGSILTNKYAEGLPRKRYYGGCEFVDTIEDTAINRAKELFKAGFANVQPHSGSQANMAAYFALLNPGDKILGMEISQGGHLTHGASVNFSGKIFSAAFYGLHQDTERLDYDMIREAALKEKPKMIVAGASAYPRAIDFKIFREIADSVQAVLLVDMAHIAGLVAANEHMSPVPHAHVVTSTTHKTLRGPRGGLIILGQDQEQIARKVNSTVFPGMQGGPLEHVIAAKAVAFKEALSPGFGDYTRQIVKNAKILGDALIEGGMPLVTGGTDNHLILAKTDTFEISGKKAEAALEWAGITCNKNMIPGDKRSPFVTSGIRLGTAALTTRGLVEEHMEMIAKWILETLRHHDKEDKLKKIKTQVSALCREFPIYKSS